MHNAHANELLCFSHTNLSVVSLIHRDPANDPKMFSSPPHASEENSMKKWGKGMSNLTVDQPTSMASVRAKDNSDKSCF